MANEALELWWQQLTDAERVELLAIDPDEARLPDRYFDGLRPVFDPSMVRTWWRGNAEDAMTWTDYRLVEFLDTKRS